MPRIFKLSQYASLPGLAIALLLVATFGTAWAREEVPVVVENSGEVANAIAQAQGLQQPFGLGLSCTFNGGQCVANFPVPASARAIIEFVTAKCFPNLATESIFDTALTTTVGPNAAASYWLLTQQQGGFGPQGAGATQISSQLVKIYADPGTQVTFTAHVPDGISPGTGGCSISLSGQEISVP